MPRPLTKYDVVERQHVLPLQSYALIANVAKGIALGVGSLVLLGIAAHLQSSWIRLVPWMASMAAILISYTKWTRGALLMNARTNIGDACFPLLMGIAEFLLFGVLGFDNDTSSSSLWLNWPLFFAGHAITGTALVNNGLRLTHVDRDFANDLSGLGAEYRRWLMTDREETTFAGIVGFLIWIILQAWVLRAPNGRAISEYVVAGFAALCIAGACKPLYDGNAQLNRIDSIATAVCAQVANVDGVSSKS